jgi:HK97 gp10 family phage protein
MPKFKGELPTDLIKDFERLQKNTEKMMSEMVEAGAKVTLSNAKNNAPDYLRKNIKVTRTYKTPSDDGINQKVIITGYFYSEHNKKSIPAPLVANVLEYGKSTRHKISTGGSTGQMPKKPFFRKSFKKAQITKAMEEVQKKYIEE